MAARRKNAAQANAPHSAPHTAPSPHPAPVAHPPAGGPAAAVWAALVAAPGATAAQIATAARTSRAIAGRELAVLETSGLATAPVSADGGPQLALAGEAAELLRREVAAAATQLAELLGSKDTATALAAIDAICAAAAHSRRLLKAAASGRKPRGTISPAARPGQLRDLVQAHLAAHPDAEFTPHAIGRVLDRSSGAVANALDRLTALGHAQLTTDKPRRYRHRDHPAPAGTTT